MGSQVQRICGKVVDCMVKAVLAEKETKVLKLAVLLRGLPWWEELPVLQERVC